VGHNRGAHNEGWHLLTEGAMDQDSSSQQRRLLGAELRRLREAAGKSQQDVHEWTKVPTTSISRMEGGKRRIPVTFVKSVLPFYGVGSPQAEALERLAWESSQPGWWAEYRDAMPPWFDAYMGMESAAQEIWTYESEYVPGILQTRRYTEATLAAMPIESPSDAAERIAALRGARRQRLTGERPPILRAVLNEAVVRREVGGPAVMREQFEHLRDAADRSNITLQVLPFNAGAHPGMLGPFTALRFDEEHMNTIYLEFDGAALYLDKPMRVQRYADTFRRLTELALSEDDTISLINEAERSLDEQ